MAEIKHKDLRQRVQQLVSGKPVGKLTYNGGSSAVDERGVFFQVRSYEEIERRRFFAQRKEGRKAAFVFNAMNSMRYVGRVLTAAQCGYLLVLATYARYDGQLVMSERDHTPMRQVDMIRALGLKPTKSSTVGDLVQQCLDYGIMTQHADGSYYIAQGIHFKGRNKQQLDVVRSYITQLRALARENKPEHVGFIYKLLPYMHKTSNVLCSNPNELNAGLVEKLTRKEIAAAAGVSEGYVSRLTRKLALDGRSVFAKITTAQGTAYMVNPSIFRRSDSADYDDTTRAIFGIS